MLTVSAFAFGLLALIFATVAGEMGMSGTRLRPAPTESKIGIGAALLFMGLAIACAVSGASH